MLSNYNREMKELKRLKVGTEATSRERLTAVCVGMFVWVSACFPDSSLCI